MYAVETRKGVVTNSEMYITINNKVYDVCSEQLSCGEYDAYTLQEIDKRLISDPETNTMYKFTLYYDHDIALKYLEEIKHEKVYYYICELKPLDEEMNNILTKYEEKLLQIIEDAKFLEDVAECQWNLLVYYKRTNQEDKYLAYLPKYNETIKTLMDDSHIDE